MRKLSVILVIIIGFSFTSYSQVELEKKLSGEYSPLELVSITQFASFNQAIKMLSAVSELVTGKSITSTLSIASPIGVEIQKMPYLDALNLIVNKFNLTYEEKPDIIVIKGKEKTEEETLKDDIYADIDAREVKISAVLFEADVAKSREVGIDWSTLLSKSGVSIGGDFSTQTTRAENAATIQQGIPPHANVTTNLDYTVADFQGNTTAMFRFFETQNLGEIITSPSVTVRDKQKGRIQVGSDFSIKQRDFSGNIIDKFYSAGSIVEVTPYVYKKNGLNYILLKINVEKSDFFPSELTTEVKKTEATTDVLLLNGEQTAIGGLFINEKNVVRTGIPFLKDLPWWVLGIRYLTGSDQTVDRKKEVIIVIKAQLLPTLEERARLEKKENIIQQQLEEHQKLLENSRPKPDYIEKYNK
jgi:general secretion pathway protein D